VIILCSFTRRAADEMRQRLRQLLPEQAADISVMTFHGLGLAILQEQQHLLDFPAPLRPITATHSPDRIVRSTPMSAGCPS
jgi:superfamily I DNA/RNA helicase